MERAIKTQGEGHGSAVGGHIRPASVMMRVCVLAVGLCIVLGVQASAAAASGCPNSQALGNQLEDPSVSASFTSIGGVATYSFTSPNKSPTGGVPGLIEYCVYTTPLPDSEVAIYSNPNGAWTAGSGGGFFDFQRSGGNPDNVPFDGSTQTMGMATWTSGTVPSSQTIVLHINDEAECSALYGAGTETCFVLPRKATCTGAERVFGIGHFGPRAPEGATLDDNLNTCLVGFKEELRYTWENATNHLALRRLTSATCVETAGEKKFFGTGIATVNKVNGYEISFKFTIAGGKTDFVMVVEKGGVVVYDFIDEPLTTSNEHISC
jgi:hypothetical protein